MARVAVPTEVVPMENIPETIAVLCLGLAFWGLVAFAWNLPPVRRHWEAALKYLGEHPKPLFYLIVLGGALGLIFAE